MNCKSNEVKGLRSTVLMRRIKKGKYDEVLCQGYPTRKTGCLPRVVYRAPKGNPTSMFLPV